MPSHHPPRIALVGDRSDNVRAHERIPVVLDALGRGSAGIVEPYWLASNDIDDGADVAGFDGIWVIPGSPYEDTEGVLTAITAARTGGIPLLGTCGGFQHIVLEFARRVCGLTTAEHAETHPEADELLLVPLACSLLGEEDAVTISAGTLAARIMGTGTTTERYFCRFGLNARYRSVLDAHGLVFSGHDRSGDARVVELPGHPFGLGTLFQPELSSDATWVHPVIEAFVAAVRARAATPTAVID
jgi:CTP synthase (UTP-ammonia lyase)